MVGNQGVRTAVRAVAIACALASLGAEAAAADAAAPGACAAAHAQPLEASPDARGAALRCLVNRERVRSGLRRLRGNRRLRAAAQGHADDMVARGYFSHVCPDGTDLVARATAARWLTESTLNWRLSEVLATGCGAAATPHAAVRGWLASPDHRRVLLDGRLRRVGIGLAGRGDCVTWVLDAGRKR